MTTLSICIPTYNRSAMLAELLDSIISQGDYDIEVVVSDDCSSDNTEKVGFSYSSKIPKYKFIRQAANIGLDDNFLAVVAAASGDFVWLMGDDDQLEPGGLGRVLDALKCWPHVCGLTLGVVDYDVTMNRVIGLRNTPSSKVLKGVAGVFGEIGDLLGFMSALVIDRRKWLAATKAAELQNFKNYYVQVYIIGRVLGRDGSWGIVHENCVRFRTGNDQFKTRLGWMDRLKLDVESYGQLSDALLESEPRSKAKFDKIIFDTHVMARIKNAKTDDQNHEGFLSIAIYLFQKYKSYPKYWLLALPTLVAPKFIIQTAKMLYKRYMQTSGEARARNQYIA